jgi:hypothetical protein
VTLNWSRALSCAAAAGTALLAWKRLGVSTREELSSAPRAPGARSLATPSPTGWRSSKAAPAPGIAVTAGPSLISHCTVVGVQGDGMYLNLQDDDDPWEPAPDDEPGDEREGQDDGTEQAGDFREEEDQDVTDETKPAPNIVPAVCEDGHTSWPGRFIRVYDTSV